MTIKWLKHGLILLILSLLFIAGENAFAQARKAPGGATAQIGKAGIEVKKVEVDYNKFKTPDYQVNNNNDTTGGTPLTWARILVRFDTALEWMDQVEMRFFVAVKHPRTGVFTIFTGAFSYSDIPKGRDHKVAVFLRPRTVERYGTPTQAAVEIYSRGELVAKGSYPEVAQGVQPWWRMATERTIEGYLLERSQTPFADIAFDSYEIPKGK